MKKILVLLLALALAVQLCACGTAQPTWQDQYDAGVAALAEENYDEAIQAFQAAIELDPTAAEAYLGLADVYLATQDYDAALDALASGEGTMDTSGHEGEIAQIYAACAQHAFDQGDYDQAIQLWTTANDWAEDDAYQAGIEEANAALLTPQTTSTLLSSSWCALCGRNLIYQFQEDGTGKVLATDGVAEISFTYTVSGDTVTIQESSQSYVWIYDEDKSWFYWSPDGLDLPGTDEADLDENGNLVAAAITEEQVQQILASSKTTKSGTAKSDSTTSQTTTSSADNDALLERLGNQIAAHYKELWSPAGNYACFYHEVEETDSTYTFILRYQLSNEEAEEMLAEGRTPAANTYVTEVKVDKSTGTVTDEISGTSWKMSLS
jgi:tetratricopeptide (TPR) repeat protein